MTLAELRTALDAAKTGNDIEVVYYDFNTILNETITKTYPFVFWAIEASEGTKNIRNVQPGQIITMDVYAAKVYAPDADKIPEWDSLIADLDAYLTKLATSQFVKPILDDFNFELFPEGFISVDREIAVRYRISLELWC